MVKNKKKLEIKNKAFKIARILAQHPASVGLIIMVGSTVGQILAFAASDEEKRKAILANTGHSINKEVFHQLKGLYDGTQTVTLVLGTVPIIKEGLGVVSQVAAAAVKKK